MNSNDTDNNEIKWGTPPGQDELARFAGEDIILGRVVRENRGEYLLAAGDDIVRAEVSGAFRYRAAVRADYPAVGDWVAARSGGSGVNTPDFAVIEHVFSRRSCFSRKAAGETTEEQIIAANIDVIFIVFALNGGRNFTAAGLERYLTVAWDSGATPVVVLNKADLCSEDECSSAVMTAEASAPGAAVRPVSAAEGTGLPELAEWLQPGITVALAGPSGVGKSTLINALSGSDMQKTGAQREADLRGRHTTTHRELFRLDSGALLIDSPGMRELQLWGESESADDAFSEIAEYAASCRFSDCSHQGEPGCAVQAALRDGELDYRRYESYLKLKNEMNYLHRRQDEAAARLEKQKWKNLSKEIRRYNKDHR